MNVCDSTNKQDIAAPGLVNPMKFHPLKGQDLPPFSLVLAYLLIR